MITLIKKLSLEAYLPSAYPAQKGFLYAGNNIRKSFYEQNQGIAVILYALETYSYDCTNTLYA